MRPSTRPQLTLVLLASALATTALAAGDDPVARLTAKGAKVRTGPGGAVTEVSFGTGSAMTLDEWRAVGRIETLTRASLSASEAGGRPLDDETAAAIAGLGNLETFFSNGAELTDDGFRAFAGWRKLRSFGLDHWFGPKGQKGFVGAGLAHLKDLPNLEHVRLGGCRVDNKAVEALAKCTSLRGVDLFHTFAVTDDGVAALRALPNLRVVQLGPQFTTRITDASLALLGQVPTLEELHVTETWLTYEGGFRHLKGLKNLKLVKIPLVLAAEEDVARLRADHPDAKVDWTTPSPEQAATLKAAFERAGAKKK